MSEGTSVTTAQQGKVENSQYLGDHELAGLQTIDAALGICLGAHSAYFVHALPFDIICYPKRSLSVADSTGATCYLAENKHYVSLCSQISCPKWPSQDRADDWNQTSRYCGCKQKGGSYLCIAKHNGVGIALSGESSNVRALLTNLSSCLP